MQTFARVRLPKLSVTKLVRTCWIGICILFMAACHLDMYDQPRLDIYEQTNTFANGRSSQAPVVGSVSRGERLTDDPVVTGKEGADFIQTGPITVTDQLISRGKERFVIFCVPCHGGIGNGRGPVAGQFRPPPASFYLDRLKTAPDGYIFDVITNGHGIMYPYGSRITAEDRWAIIAYIRTLQQNPPAAVRPADYVEPTVTNPSQNIPPILQTTPIAPGE